MVGITHRSPSKRTAIAKDTNLYSYREVAKIHKCSISTVSRLVKQQRDEGTNRLAPHPGPSYKVQGQSEQLIGRLIRQNRFATTRNLLLIVQDSGISISLSVTVL